MPLYNVLCKELTSYKYFAYRIPACYIFTETETSLYATTVPWPFKVRVNTKGCNTATLSYNMECAVCKKKKNIYINYGI